MFLRYSRSIVNEFWPPNKYHFLDDKQKKRKVKDILFKLFGYCKLARANRTRHPWSAIESKFSSKHSYPAVSRLYNGPPLIGQSRL